jgi:hypothetical protein
MKKQLLGLAMSAGLAFGTAGTGFAQESSTPLQACAGFVGDMSQRWSSEGYSSLENALTIEGGDWFRNDCLSSGVLAQAVGTYGLPNDPLRGQSAQVANLLEQNGIALGGSFGSGQLEDDENNGSVNTRNDVKGGKNGGQEDDEEGN